MSINSLFSPNNFTTYSAQSITSDLQVGNVQIIDDTLQPVNTQFTTSQLATALNGGGPTGNINGKITTYYVPLCTSTDFLSNSPMQIIGNTLLTGCNTTIDGTFFVGEETQLAGTALLDSTLTVKGTSVFNNSVTITGPLSCNGSIITNTSNASAGNGYIDMEAITEYEYRLTVQAGFAPGASFTFAIPPTKTYSQFRKLSSTLILNTSSGLQVWEGNGGYLATQVFVYGGGPSNIINVVFGPQYGFGAFAAVVYVYVSYQS